MEIRTPKDKLYGTLDLNTYIMTVLDGKNIRQFPIPTEGCRLWYREGNNPLEEVTIQPQRVFLKTAM